MTAFEMADTRYAAIKDFLAGSQAMELTHTELETWLQDTGRQLLRHLYQDHLDLRALRELRQEGVIDAEGTPHNAVEKDHQRTLTTIVGGRGRETEGLPS